MPNPCIFCRSTDKKITKEDLFPLWLNELFGPFLRGRERSLVEYVNPTDGTLKSYFVNILRQPVRVVCETCNNGWMSQLEMATQPMLTPMLLRGRATRLTPPKQHTLASWAVKTALVSQHLYPSQRFVPDSEYDRFYAVKEPPSGYQVLIAHRANLFDETNREALALLRSEAIPRIMIPEVMREEVKEQLATRIIYRISFAIGRVMFVVIGHNYDGTFLIQSNLPRVFDSIWPPQKRVRWPPPLSVEYVGGLPAIHDAFGGPPPVKTQG